MKLELQFFEPLDEGGTTVRGGGDGGYSAGDAIYEHHRILDAESREERGRVVRELHVIEAAGGDDFLFMVHATLRLPDGAIHYSGAATFSEVAGGTAVIPIAGGTGAYAGAAGTVTGRLADEGIEGLFLTVAAS